MSSEPRQPLDPEEEREGIMATGNAPPDNPPIYAMMMATNTGIALFSLAAILFCVKQLHQAFWLAMLVILGLALGNLVLLAMGLRRAVRCDRSRAAEIELAVASAKASAAAARAAVAALNAPAGTSTEDRPRRQAAS